jgi:hypothetical protein
MTNQQLDLTTKCAHYVHNDPLTLPLGLTKWPLTRGGALMLTVLKKRVALRPSIAFV